MRADFSLDYDVLSVERPQQLYLMARFISGPAPHDRVRRPLNISLVIDRSGSMAGDKIDYTRQAAQFLVQHLSANDVFSLVMYNDKIETLVQPDFVVNKDHIVQLIEQIRVRGTTNLSGGWLEGCTHVAAQLREDRINRVLLMSDGLANRGVTDPQHLISLARQKRDEGISTTTMGLGRDFNEDLMMEMANAGGGAFYFIESPEVTPAIFQEELSGLLNVVGQNLTISVQTSPHVRSLKQLNAYPETVGAQQVVYRLGDVYGDEVKTIVLELGIPALNTIGEQQIALLRFEYDEIAERSQRRTLEVPVMVNLNAQESSPALSDPAVAEAVLLLKAARARQSAIQAADKGDYQAAAQQLRDVAAMIEQSYLRNQQLIDERKSLLEQAARMDRGSNAYDEYSRKTMSTQAFYTMNDRHNDTMMLRRREDERQNGQPDPINTEGPTMGPSPALRREELSEQEPAIQVPRQPGVVPTHVLWNDTSFEINLDLMRMGRAVHNEIMINQRGVSRFHCQIRRDGDKLLLEDLGSTNGTMIDGKRITGPHTLSVGDEIYLCDERLVFVRR